MKEMELKPWTIKIGDFELEMPKQGYYADEEILNQVVPLDEELNDEIIVEEEVIETEIQND